MVHLPGKSIEETETSVFTVVIHIIWSLQRQKTVKTKTSWIFDILRMTNAN